jgi:hypothetical protein
MIPAEDPGSPLRMFRPPLWPTISIPGSLAKTSVLILRTFIFSAVRQAPCLSLTSVTIAGDIPTPGYHPEGIYEFKADLNGDAVEELTSLGS